VAELSSTARNWNWKLVGDRYDADLSLELGANGIPVRLRPLALVVPFTSSWEEITLLEAENVVAFGHEQVAIMDWASMPVTHKALRVDGKLPHEPGYPLHERWEVVGTMDYHDQAQKLVDTLESLVAYESIIHLAAVGDIMLDRRLGNAINQGMVAFPFFEVASILTTADIAVGNLESAIGDVGIAAQKSYTFRAPSRATEALAIAGFDLLTLANNHAVDYGQEALLNTIYLLNQKGISTVGAGIDVEKAHLPYVTKVRGVNVVFLGYVSVPYEASGFNAQSWSAKIDEAGVAWADPEQIFEDVKKAQEIAQVVIVSLHSGVEFVPEPDSNQLAAAEAAVRGGADLVIGHHTHVLQGLSFQGTSVVAFGLGNFAFDMEADPRSVILNVWLDKDGVRQVELIPIIVQPGGQPRLAVPGEAEEIRGQVYMLTSDLND
jgi:poly-gamma-glutamate synthesis protein (capsule biosynthesis protein)